MTKPKYFYNQNNYSAYQYKKANGTYATIASGGCGLCSTLNAINNLAGKEIYTITGIRDLAQKCGARTNDGTDVTTLLKAICKAHPDFSFKVTSKNADLVSHMKKGGYAIINQGDTYNVFSSSGHFVCAYGIENNDDIYVMDSAYTTKRYKLSPRSSRIIREITGYGAVVDIVQIGKCSIDRNPSYYLISYSGKKVTTTTTTTSKVEPYKVGSTYTLKYDLNVRVGAGTNYRQKKTSELSSDGRKHALNQTYATLKAGTKVTCNDIIKKGNDIWFEIPSGYVAAYYNGKTYIS